MLQDFKLRACVDWVEVRVTLPHTSSFHHVQARMPATWGKPFVHPLAPKVYGFRIQDPGSPGEVLALAQQLVRDGTPLSESAIEIIGIEVAADFTPTTDAARAQLAQVVTYLAEHLAKPPPGPRLLLHKGRFMAAAGRRAITTELQAGRTLTIGHKGATNTARAYLKTYDSQPGRPAYAPLPAAQHRARIERTLTGDDCPIRTLQDWRGFKFEGLASLFAIVRTAGAVGPLRQLMRDQWGAPLGTTDDPAKRTARRRNSAPATARDTATNERIRQALRNLTARTARTEKCANSVDFSAHRAASTEEESSPAPVSSKYLNTKTETEFDALILTLEAYVSAPALLPLNPPGISAATTTET